MLQMSPQAKQRIEATFEGNLRRARSLIEAHDALGSPGAADTSVQQTDVLRAAVVLLHATLEDLVRTSSEELLPHAGPQVLNEIGFPDGPDKTKAKFTLGELHAHKGRAVDDLIREAVHARLQRSNYNRVSELAAALARIGLDPGLLGPHQDQMEALMKRRHLIVHRGDKEPHAAPGQPMTGHLAKPTVDAWARIIEATGRKVMDELPSHPGAER